MQINLSMDEINDLIDACQLARKNRLEEGGQYGDKIDSRYANIIEKLNRKKAK